VNIHRFIVIYFASYCGWKGEWIKVYFCVVRNVLVFESADVGLKHVKRQTDVETGTQRDRKTDRQTEYSSVHINEHKRQDVVCSITNIS